MADLLVYAVDSRARTARAVLSAACRATGFGARLELYSSGGLYQRLGPRHAQPLPDLVLWFGPFAAQAAALDGLLKAHQPAAVAESATHDPDWLWTTLDYSPVGVVGSPPVLSLQELATAPRLAVADPERSEVGLSILLTMLDRARQVDANVEAAWVWWQQRVQRGVAFAEDDPGAQARVASAAASHALTLVEAGAPLPGLAPLPHTVALAASSPNVDQARRMLDWLVSPAAAGSVRLSPWQAPGDGPLPALIGAAPPLDVGWGHQQYAGVRRRWAQSGFGPQVVG